MLFKDEVWQTQAAPGKAYQ